VRWLLLLSLTAQAETWDRFRGPNGSGVLETSLPAELGPGKNLLWKTDLPAGLSSPVLNDRHIFLTAADGADLVTLCLERASGRILWKRAVKAGRTEKLHELNHASAASVAVTHDRVISFFGNFGLVAYDHDGGERWRLPLGPFTNLYGMGASPVIADGKLILVCDQSKDSFIAAFDLGAGKQLWRTARPEALSGHSTPIVHGKLIIAPGSFRMDAYDIATGRIAWTAEGLPSEMKSVPVIDGSTLYIHGFNTPDNDPGRLLKVPSFAEILPTHDSNKDGLIAKSEAPTQHSQRLFAYIDLDGNGTMNEAEWSQYRRTMQAENALLAYDISGSQPMLKWKFQRSIPQLPSPLVYRRIVYMINESGVLTTLDAATGQLHKQARLRAVSDRYYASPVAADGKVFIASHAGVLSVLEAGPEQKLLSSSDFGEEILATPAIAPGRLYLRSRNALWCFGNPQVGRAQR
jgi:outer membrane protein assembly factor BamB